MGVRNVVRRLGRAVYRILSSGEDRSERGLAAAERRKERDRLFEVFARGGIAGHGSTAPTGDPPHNLRGSRPDRDEE